MAEKGVKTRKKALLTILIAAAVIFMLIMLFMGDLATYNFVWQLNDISITLMTIINILIIVPISGQALKSLKEYEALRKEGKRP